MPTSAEAKTASASDPGFTINIGGPAVRQNLVINSVQVPAFTVAVTITNHSQLDAMPLGGDEVSVFCYTDKGYLVWGWSGSSSTLGPGQTFSGDLNFHDMDFGTPIAVLVVTPNKASPNQAAFALARIP
jgi:hypothetical protein